MAKRVLLIVGLVAVALTAYATGFYENLNLESIRTLVQDAGWWGPPIFVAAFLIQGMALSPAFPFLLAAALIWPPWEAFALNMAGCMASCLIGFVYTRTLGRELVERRLPESMRRFEKRVVERELGTVVLLRTTFFLAPYAHWALGLSPVRWPAYLLGSAIGCVPWVVGFTFFGSVVMEWAERQGPRLWLVLGGVLLLVIAAIVWRRVTSTPEPEDS